MEGWEKYNIINGVFKDTPSITINAIIEAINEKIKAYNGTAIELVESNEIAEYSFVVSIHNKITELINRPFYKVLNLGVALLETSDVIKWTEALILTDIGDAFRISPKRYPNKEWAEQSYKILNKLNIYLGSASIVGSKYRFVSQTGTDAAQAKTNAELVYAVEPERDGFVRLYEGWVDAVGASRHRYDIATATHKYTLATSNINNAYTPDAYLYGYGEKQSAMTHVDYDGYDSFGSGIVEDKYNLLADYNSVEKDSEHIHIMTFTRPSSPPPLPINDYYQSWVSMQMSIAVLMDYSNTFEFHS